MAATASASVDTSSVPKMVWVKDLTESNITSIPSRYAYSDSAYSNAINISKDDNPDVVVDANIPTIDFSLLTSSSPDERSKAIQELGKACREWGFFLVINHGVPEKLMKGMLDAVQDFFNQPEEEKLRGAGKGMLDPIRSGTSFNSSVEKVLFWRDFLKVWVHPEFYSPPSPPHFSEISFEYSKTIRQVTRELLKGISESLGLEEECYIEKAVELESGFQILIANLYPTCPQPELALGMPPHSDHGLLTILTQNGVDGLQILHDGKWVNVKALPNSFLVNTGDHLEILSNGKYKSVLHRVAVNNKAARISIAMAHGPNLEKVVAPAPELVNNQDNPPAYLGMKYKEFLLLQQSNQLDMKTVLDRLRV